MNCVMCQRALIRPFSRETTPQVCVCEMEHYQCFDCDERMDRHCGFCGRISHVLSIKLHLELAMEPRTAFGSSKPTKKGNLFQCYDLDDWSVDSKVSTRNYHLEKKRDLLERKRSLSEISDRDGSAVKRQSRSNSVAGERLSCGESQRGANAKSISSDETEPSSQITVIEKSSWSSEQTPLRMKKLGGNQSGRSLPVNLKKAIKQVNIPGMLKLEMQEKPEKPEKPEKSEKPEKPEKSEKPEKPEKSEKPKKQEVSTANPKRGNMPVMPLEYNALAPPSTYILELQTSEPINSDPHSLGNLISMARRVVYAGRTWKKWHSANVSSTAVDFDKLLKLRKSMESVELPIAMKDILKTFDVAKCPEFNCSSTIFLEELNDHLMNSHRLWTIAKIGLGQPKSFSLDLRLTLRNIPKCHAVMQLENVVTGFGKCAEKNLLPIMVMSMHIKLGDITANSNSDQQLTAIWATTVVSNILPLRVTLSMWSLEGDKPEYNVSYTGQPYDLRSTRRPLKILTSGRAIILTSDQVAGLTQNGNEMVGIQISAKMDVSVKFTKGTPEDTDTEDGNDDESLAGN